MKTEYRKLLLYFLVLVFCVITVLVLLILSSVESPIYTKLKWKSNVNYILPQGWAFFTRDAREERITLMTWENDSKKLKRYNSPGFSSKHRAGFDRSVRKLMLEYGFITYKITDADWIDFEGDLDSLGQFLSQLSPIEIINNSLEQNLCGEIFAVKASPMPWAWSSFKDVNMPSKILKLNVRCKD